MLNMLSPSKLALVDISDVQVVDYYNRPLLITVNVHGKQWLGATTSKGDWTTDATELFLFIELTEDIRKDFFEGRSTAAAVFSNAPLWLLGTTDFESSLLVTRIVSLEGLMLMGDVPYPLH